MQENTQFKLSPLWALPAALGVVIVLMVVYAFTSFLPAQRRMERNSALFVASSRGDAEAAVKAIHAGGDPNAKNWEGLTPLMLASRGYHPDMKAPQATDYPDMVRALIRNHADVNAATGTGVAPLLWAARYGHEKALRVLIDSGADINAKDHNGLTALRWATTNRMASPAAYGRIIAMLEKAGSHRSPSQDGRLLGAGTQ